MLFLVFLISFLQVQPDSAQVSHYINQIEESESISIHLWSLNELLFSNCESYDRLINQLNNSDLSSIYSGINCENNYSVKQTDSLKNITLQRLALQYDDSQLQAIPVVQNAFNNESNENLASFLERVDDSYSMLIDSVYNKKEITPLTLPYKEDLLLHFNILINTELRRTIINDDYMEGALSAWLEIKDSYNTNSTEYSLLLANIISVAYITDRYDVIFDTYSEFLEHPYFPEIYYKSRIFTFLDYSLYIYGRYDEALSLQRRYSIPLAKHLDNQELLREIKGRQGAYLISIGKYEASKEVNESLFTNNESFLDQYIIFTNLGISYKKLGQNNKYLSFQLQALNQFTSLSKDQREERYTSLLRIYRNLFIYYTEVKDINTALDVMDRAREVALSYDDKTELALIDSFLGSFYWDTRKDSEKALHHLSKAKNIISAEVDYEDYSNLLYERIEILTAIDSLSSAMNDLQEVKELALSKSDTPNYIEALVDEMVIQLKVNNYGEVSHLLKEVKLYKLDNIDFELLVKYYTTVADYYYQTGFTREAVDELSPVVEQVVQRAKNNTDSQSGYWTVSEEYLDAFSLMIELLTESGATKKAITLLDQIKTINDASLYNSPLVKASKLSEEQLVEEGRLNAKLQDLRKRYLNADEEDRFALNVEIDQISAEREEILNQVNLNREQELSPIWSIQRLIGKDELVLHFTEIANHIYITELSFDDINIRKVTLNKEDAALFSEAANNLASGSTNLSQLYRIYEILELRSLPANFKYLSVIPDNNLYRIPIEILPTNQPASSISYGASRYLIEDFHFSYYSSLKEYEENQRMNRTSSAADYFSAFAISNFENTLSTNLPSLPYATVEVNNIGAALTSISSRQIYTGKQATKETFKRELSKSKIVHVATHSEVSEQDPLFSTIYLNTESEGDSLESSQALYAYELFDTPFNSEFVMLNSCSSGSGNYIQGTGIIGITRALRYAGAKSLALNLWSVNDKVASQFAVDFYKQVNEGTTKSEAIRLAKLNQLRTANANPHFWGAYMLIGNSAPITNKPSKPVVLFSLLAVTIVVIGYTSRKTILDA